MPAEPLSLEDLTLFIGMMVERSPSNRLTHVDDSPMFEAPLAGVADGDDPLFASYKEIIGSYHLTPREILASVAPQFAQDTSLPVRVFCWVLPISTATKTSSAAMKNEPSQRWAHTRYYGELFNNEVRAAVAAYICTHGGVAIAPATSPLLQSVRDASGGLSSTWSERHALYAAALGTFGLCDGFLTPVGKAMRCGSVVTDIPLQANPKLFDSHTSACNYLEHGRCGDCMARCPARAIKPSGHDKAACERYQEKNLRPLREMYGVPITGCGLCQTGVPCESGLPE